MSKMLVLNVAALSPNEVEHHTVHFKNLGQKGTLRPLVAPQPALTSSSHATMLNGSLPKEHGIIANGWYERDHAKVFNWGRSDHLVQGRRIWDDLKQHAPSMKVANLFWRQCTHSSCDLVMTERPTYFSNGRKGADVYCSDSTFKKRCLDQLGAFPFFHFWGPKAGLNSSKWITDVARLLMREEDYNLILCYAPGLDYDGQRFGPSSPQALNTLSQGDQLMGEVIQEAQNQGYDVVIVSDYGFVDVQRPILLNRALREKGYVKVTLEANGEWLEMGESRAFAVCDNQAAHIYIKDPQDREEIRSTLLEIEGVREVRSAEESECLGHARSGDLLAIADEDAWFAYPYWIDEAQAPDFSKCVDIFNKPGFDPCEMFMRSGLLGKLHVAKRFIQLKTGIRAPFDVIEPDVHLVRGARNLLPQSPNQGATCITSWKQDTIDPLYMQDLKHLLLKRLLDSTLS